MKARCIVADDHAILRYGLRRILESVTDFAVVAEASDAGEAYDLASKHKPELVLMDIGMPGPSAFEMTRRIRKELPHTKVVFVTMFEDNIYLQNSLEVQASGYVLKDTPPEQIISGLRDVLRGRRFVSSNVVGNLVNAYLNKEPLAGVNTHLTPREREIVKLLAEGNSVKEVAVQLGISSKTVEAHKFNLMQKLNIGNRTQLVAYAIQSSIVPCPGMGKCPSSRVALRELTTIAAGEAELAAGD